MAQAAPIASEKSRLPASFRQRFGRWIAMLYLFAMASGAILSTVAFFYRDWLFVAAGGQPLFDDDGSTILQEGLDPATLVFWAQKLLYQGIIPFAISGLTIGALVYALLLWGFGLLPWYRIQGPIAHLRATLEQKKLGDVQSLSELLQGNGRNSSRERWLNARFQLLDGVYAGSRNRETVRQANDRYTAYQESAIDLGLLPLVYAEWALPILGFIGTVWGVTEAVEGLRLAVATVVIEQDANTAVLAPVNQSFKGLILAFDTTLFGLIGLIVVGTVAFILRKGAFSVVLAVDKWTGEAINLLREENLVRMLVEGLLETDANGQIVPDERDNKPVLRLQGWLEQMRLATVETDESGQPVLEEGSQKPVPRWQSWADLIAKGIFETDNSGRPIVKGDGIPTLRSQRWMDLMLTEFFFADQEGEVMTQEGTGIPLSKSEYWRRRTYSMLLQELFEVSQDEAHQIADGVVEGSEEIVPLASTLERRHRQVRMGLDLLAILAQEFAKSHPPGEGGEGGVTADVTRLHPIFSANGVPIRCVAMNDYLFFAFRNDSPDGYEQTCLAGKIETVAGGAMRQPSETGGPAPPDGVESVILHENYLICGAPMTRSVSIVDIADPTSWPREHILEKAEGVAQGLAVIKQNSTSLVVFAESGRSDTLLLGVPLFEPSDAATTLRSVKGALLAIASHGDRSFAMATNANGKVSVTSHIDGKWRSFEVRCSVTSLSFAGPDTLAFGTENGLLGTLDLTQDRSTPTILNKPSKRIDAVAVTNFDQIVGWRAATGDVVVAGTDETGECFSVSFDAPVTAMAGAPNGRSIILGLESGAAMWWEINGRIPNDAPAQ